VESKYHFFQLKNCNDKVGLNVNISKLKHLSTKQPARQK